MWIIFHILFKDSFILKLNFYSQQYVYIIFMLEIHSEIRFSLLILICYCRDLFKTKIVNITLSEFLCYGYEKLKFLNFIIHMIFHGI
jgi:hypothetical protein